MFWRNKQQEASSKESRAFLLHRINYTPDKVKVKSKAILLQAMEAHRVARG
jgi:hypothetical protein